MDQTTNLHLPFIMPSQAQKQVTHNQGLQMLDVVVQLSVLDRDLAAPPATPGAGARYIVAAGGSGAWAGKDNSIAAWQDGAWSFFAPLAGWRAWIADESILLVWTGGNWARLETTFTALQELTELGVGTSADGSNPFSAKLNAALWTAKYTAEGGSGDLRYTMNKEAASNTASLLLQSNWSGRAEIGLAGDDNLHVKISADGSSWIDALIVDSTASAMTMAIPVTVEVDDGCALSIDLEEGNSVFQATRYAESSNAPVFMGRKARGSRATPAAVQAGDTLIGFRGYGHDGSGFVSGGAGVAFLLEAAEGWAHGTNLGTQIRLFTTQNGSTANVERLKIANDGSLQVRAGAQTLVDANGIIGLRGYTLASLPSAATAGQLIYVADGSSNKRLAVSDGTNWRWPDGAIVA
jgi:hypothetical protein